MYNQPPCELDEIIDQCRALIYAIVTVESQEAKETLSFILWEHMDELHQAYLKEMNTPNIA